VGHLFHIFLLARHCTRSVLSADRVYPIPLNYYRFIKRRYIHVKFLRPHPGGKHHNIDLEFIGMWGYPVYSISCALSLVCAPPCGVFLRSALSCALSISLSPSFLIINTYHEELPKKRVKVSSVSLYAELGGRVDEEEEWVKFTEGQVLPADDNVAPYVAECVKAAKNFTDGQDLPRSAQ